MVSRKALLRKLKALRVRVQRWSKDNIPRGLRLVAGMVLMLGGMLSFLPVLGIWMFPLGVAVAALDVVPFVRWIRGQMWL